MLGRRINASELNHRKETTRRNGYTCLAEFLGADLEALEVQSNSIWRSAALYKLLYYGICSIPGCLFTSSFKVNHGIFSIILAFIYVIYIQY